MIDYSKVNVGDKLRIVGAGAPGFANLGDTVEVMKTGTNRVDVKRDDGATAFFALTCGAARLEPEQRPPLTPLRPPRRGRLTHLQGRLPISRARVHSLRSYPPCRRGRLPVIVSSATSRTSRMAGQS